jgi:membrane-associated phospholipid phosphatase
MLLRVAEWINLLAFSSYTALAWPPFHFDRAKRIKISSIGAAGLVITIFTSLVLPRIVPTLPASVCRDWIPYVLLLMFYWQAGQFVNRADVGFEATLERLDSRVVAPLFKRWARHSYGVWILAYLELAYLFCYASMPMGLGALYLLHRGREVDHFWAVVLPAAYACYGTLAFLQTRPPRALGEKWSVPLRSGRVRSANLWILQHASIQANTFPSGHVASSFACALVLLRLGPLWVGPMFLFIAISICLGAVAGRYHYTMDVVLGIILAVTVFLTETALTGFIGGD